MNQDEIAQLRALEQAATPGPWVAAPDESEFVIWMPDAGHDGAMVEDEADAALIAAVRNALPGLLDAAEEAERLRRTPTGEDRQVVVATLTSLRDQRDALRAELDALRGRVAELADDIGSRATPYEQHPEFASDRYLDGVATAFRVAETVVRDLLDGPA